jgi:hypothetical protein
VSDERSPRAWRLSDGGTLIEGPASPLSGGAGAPTPRRSDGEPLTEERTYYRLDPQGRLERSYEPTDWSIGHEYGVGVYLVEGNTLFSHCATIDSSTFDHTYSARDEQKGLVPLAPEEVPSVEQIRALVAEYRERRRAKGLRTNHLHWPGE